MHIVRCVFIRKIYDGRSPTVALSRFDFFNCQAVTTLWFFFSFAVGGSRLGARIWATVLWGFLFPSFMTINSIFLKLSKRQFKASSITLAWPMLPSNESFRIFGKTSDHHIPFNTKTLLNCSAVFSHFCQGSLSHTHCLVIITSLFQFCAWFVNLLYLRSHLKYNDVPWWFCPCVWDDDSQWRVARFVKNWLGLLQYPFWSQEAEQGLMWVYFIQSIEGTIQIKLD